MSHHRGVLPHVGDVDRDVVVGADWEWLSLGLAPDYDVGRHFQIVRDLRGTVVTGGALPEWPVGAAHP